MDRGYRDGQAQWGEPDSTGVRAGVRRSAEARRESGSAQSQGSENGTGAFLEFLARRPKPVTNCNVDVESARGGKGLGRNTHPKWLLHPASGALVVT